MISKIKYRQVRPLRRHLPPRQLRVRAVRGRQQLGQGALHRGRGAGGQRAGRGEEGGRGLRLSAGIPADSLPGWRHWLRHGNTSHLQGQGGVPRQDHELLQRGPLTQGMAVYWIKA